MSLSLSDSSSSSSLNITTQEEPMGRRSVLSVLHWTCSVLLLLLSVYLIVLALVGNISPFTLHPIFMGIAFLVLFPQAIAFFDSDLHSSFSHKERVKYHLYCQVAGIICAFIGFIAIYVNKNLYGKNHFTSYHGLSGLLVMIVVAFVGIGGSLTYYSFSLRTYVRPVVLKIFHSGGGILTLIAGGLTVILGLYSHWYQKFGAASLIYPTFFLIIFNTCLILRRSAFTLKERITSTFVRNNL